MCSNTRPTLYLWHQAVISQTQSSLINITSVPLRTTAPRILHCWRYVMSQPGSLLGLFSGSCHCIFLKCFSHSGYIVYISLFAFQLRSPLHSKIPMAQDSKQE